jgi:hypothetical protein
MGDFFEKLLIALIVKAIDKVSSSAYAADVVHAIYERFAQGRRLAALRSAIIGLIRAIASGGLSRRARLFIGIPLVAATLSTVTLLSIGPLTRRMTHSQHLALVLFGIACDLAAMPLFIANLIDQARFRRPSS